MAESLEVDDLDYPDIPVLFGRYLVLSGLVQELELEAAIIAQHELNSSFALAALEQGLLGHADLLRCREHQRGQGLTFEEAVRSLEALAPADIDRIKARMEQGRLRIGDVLLARGALGKEQLGQALRAYQTNQSGNWPYWGVLGAGGKDRRISA
jgi:hypothetical protein